MGHWKNCATLIAFVMAPAAGAHAADPSYPPMAPNAPMYVDEYATGWYLRGDVGYRFNAAGDATAYFWPNPVNNRVEDSINYGGGVGFKSGWFRTDLTVDYGGARYYGDATIPGNYQMNVYSIVGLLNAYADLGTWYGITPYLGVGVGVSYIQGLALLSQTLPNNGDPPPGKNTNFAWAAMAGFSYPLMRNVLLDMGYRYLALGTIESGIDNRRNQVTVKDFAAHEVRAGLRFTFD